MRLELFHLELCHLVRAELRRVVFHASFLAFALSLSAVAVAQDLTLRVNDLDAGPGTLATVEIRTYSPRPVGQGQICLVGRRSFRSVASPTLGQTNGDQPPGSTQAVSTLIGSPFAQVVGARVNSDQGDAQWDVRVVTENGVSMLVIEFESASATINSSDGPMVEFDVRLRDDLILGDEYEIAVDLENTDIRGPQGESVELRSEPGRLRIRSEADGGGDDGGGGDEVGVLGFSQRTFRARENQGEALITVARRLGDDGPIAVNYLVTGGTAGVQTDFVPVEGKLQWLDDDDAPKSFSIPILVDAREEPTETVNLELVGPTGGASLDTVLHRAVLEIADNRPTVTDELRFAPDSLQVPETGEAQVRLIRSGNSQSSRRVQVSTKDGSAMAGLDYQSTSAVLFWGPGESGSRSLTVPILDDVLDEGQEEFFVETDAGVAARVQILDNDQFGERCRPTGETLCLHDGRFQVGVRWTTSKELSGVDVSGIGKAEKLSASSGTFWFFSKDNKELLVKVLDACALPSFETYWVFFAATTNVEFVLTVTDLETGLSREYENPLGESAKPVQDTSTFAVCP